MKKSDVRICDFCLKSIPGCSWVYKSLSWDVPGFPAATCKISKMSAPWQLLNKPRFSLITTPASDPQTSPEMSETPVVPSGSDRRQQGDEFTEISVPAAEGEQRAFYQRLDEQRVTGHLCDVEVVVEMRKFPAHRCVLAAQSDYFQSMFNHAFIEGQQKEIRVLEVTAEGMEQVLAFLYTGRCRVNKHTAVDVLKAADMLLVTDLKQRIADYLVDNLSLDNALYLYRIGKICNIVSLERGVKSRIVKELFVFAMTDEFAEVTKEELVLFLTDDERVLQGGEVSPESREELAFQSVLKWVQSDPSRKVHMKELMSYIHFPLMQAPYVIEVVKEAPLMAECPEFVDEAVKYHMMEGRRGHLQSSRTRPVLAHSDSVIFAIKQEGPKAHLACFVSKHNRWYELQYLCLQEGESVTCASPFKSGPALSLMVGTSSGRVYDIEVTQMGEFSTTLPRPDLTCDRLLSVDGNKKMYVFCTQRHPGSKYIMQRLFRLSVAQYVDTASCEELPGLPLPLLEYETVVLNQKIYAVGHDIQWRLVRNMQCFDPNSLTWSVIRMPSFPNIASTLFCPLDRLALGFPSREGVHIYIPLVNKWKLARWNLPVDDEFFVVYQDGWHILSKERAGSKCSYFLRSKGSQNWLHMPSLPWDSCTVVCGTNQ